MRAKTLLLTATLGGAVLAFVGATACSNPACEPSLLLCTPGGVPACDDACGCTQCAETGLTTVEGQLYYCMPEGCYMPVASTREFQGVRTAGPTAPPSHCHGVDNGQLTLRFVLMADDGTPVRPGESFDDATIDAESIGVSFEASALFEPGDGECSDGSCTQADMTCASAQTGAPARCHAPAEIDVVGTPTFESDISRPQLFGLLLEHAGSLEGYLPADLGRLFPDTDGDGVAEGVTDTTVKPDRASDPNRQSQAALAVLINNWGSWAARSDAEGRDTHFGLWTFDEDVFSTVAASSPDGAPWTLDRQVVENARHEIAPAQATRAHVFSAIEEVLDGPYADPAYTDFDKMLLVIVDGPDDLGATADAVLARANALGVRIFIAHLDSSTDAEAFRDDPVYWQTATACGDDADCASFERCRVPTSYASTAMAPVDVDPNGVRYCLPTRAPDTGRLGPIADYARLACATSGGYIYVREPSGIRPRIDWLPLALDGLWRVDVTVDALASPAVVAGAPYPLQSTMSVTIGGERRTVALTQTGEPIAPDEGADTRPIVFP